jgi:FtsP/CotA-like multicopper oxidase with cupredoxin domain
MYHPHADEMTQMAMGMMGSWVTHPKDKASAHRRGDRDFCFLLNAYDIEPGSYTPKIMTMLDFNLWSPGTAVSFRALIRFNVRLNDKVRVRIGNLTMTNHPIHLHGHEFQVTGTDGGPVPLSARWPEVTTTLPLARCGRSSLLPMKRVIGRFTATKATTP